VRATLSGKWLTHKKDAEKLLTRGACAVTSFSCDMTHQETTEVTGFKTTAQLGHERLTMSRGKG